jgi:hypothetical protein
MCSNIKKEENTMKKSIENAKLMVGPAFEELTEGTMMEMDGEGTEWLTPVSTAISASSPWCLSGLSVSIITYTVVHG